MKTALLLAATLIITSAAPAFAHGDHGKPKPTSSKTVAVTSVGGGFALTDHHGKAVTEKSWPGKYKLVFFGFTSCPDVCPATMTKVAAILEKFDPKAEKVAPLFITVDPEVDTPKVLAGYVAAFNPHIVGLTGTQEQIDQVVSGYKVYAAKQAGTTNVDHSSYLYLMSPDDQLLQVYNAEEGAASVVAKMKESVK